MKIRIMIPVEFYVPYILDVSDINPEEIRNKLKDITPDQWEIDPDFYEEFGLMWKDIIERLTDAEIAALSTPI